MPRVTRTAETSNGVSSARASSARPSSPAAPRPALSRERILDAAMQLADADGIDALTMRRLAERLGVEAMSIYYHLPNKEAILDGLIEMTFVEIAGESGVVASIPTGRADATWRRSLRDRILAARRVMLRHPWVPTVMESRQSMGQAMARHIDGVVGTMRSGGLSYDLIHHGLHAIGSRMFGFTQEMRLDGGDAPPPPPEQAAALEAAMREIAPNLYGMLAEVVHDDPDSTLGWCDDQTEFEFALDLLLDGLERRHADEV